MFYTELVENSQFPGALFPNCIPPPSPILPVFAAIHPQSPYFSPMTSGNMADLHPLVAIAATTAHRLRGNLWQKVSHGSVAIAVTTNDLVTWQLICAENERGYYSAALSQCRNQVSFLHRLRNLHILHLCICRICSRLCRSRMGGKGAFVSLAAHRGSHNRG
jgi:hypothetical protein